MIQRFHLYVQSKKQNKSTNRLKNREQKVVVAGLGGWREWWWAKQIKGIMWYKVSQSWRWKVEYREYRVQGITLHYERWWALTVLSNKQYKEMLYHYVCIPKTNKKCKKEREKGLNSNPLSCLAQGRNKAVRNKALLQPWLQSRSDTTVDLSSTNIWLHF